MTTIRPLVLVLLCGLAPAHADTLYKCVAKGRAPSFQSTPCPPGTATAAIREFTPDPAPPRAAVATAPPRSTTRITTVRHRAGPPPIDPCTQARAARDDWERRVGLKRTYDQLREWNDRVARACR